jgi:hypothetical protein
MGGFLAVLSGLLMVNLIFNLRDVNAGAFQALPAVHPEEAKTHHPEKKASSPDIEQYHVNLHVDELQELDARPLPQLERNPFEFEAPKPQPGGPGGLGPGGAGAPGVTAPAQDAPPPAPPPVPVKLVGYADLSGGKREAYLADDEQVYVVHAGDALLGRFKVLRIEPGFVELQDDASHQKIQLVMPE